MYRYLNTLRATLRRALNHAIHAIKRGELNEVRRQMHIAQRFVQLCRLSTPMQQQRDTRRIDFIDFLKIDCQTIGQVGL